MTPTDTPNMVTFETLTLYTCPVCLGKGRGDWDCDWVCPRCDGEGVVEEYVTVTLEVPPDCEPSCDGDSDVPPTGKEVASMP